MRAKVRVSHRSFLASTLIVVAVFCAMAVFSASTASAEVVDIVTFDFSSVPGASVRFTGTDDKIEFPSTAPGGYDFTITYATSPLLGGLKGNIGGTFTVGAITTTVIPGIGTMEQAGVTTTDGLFSITDGDGYVLTANLDWTDITVYNKSSGVMNAMGTANLTGSAYAGSAVDLLDLRDASDGAVTLTFQFSALTKKSLAQLMVDGQVNSTSYSGSASATVPEPAAMSLLAMGGIAMIVRRRRK